MTLADALLISVSRGNRRQAWQVAQILAAIHFAWQGVADDTRSRATVAGQVPR